MQIDDLLRKRKIHRHRASREEIRRLLQPTDRDLRMARLTMAEDWDWAFSIAYNAVLQSARAYMYSEGTGRPLNRATRTPSPSCEPLWATIFRR